MPDKKIYTLQAHICKALGHPARIEIIDLLEKKEMSFGKLLEKIGVPKSNLSQHLSSMRNKGIIIQRKEGLHVYYKLSSKKVATACKIMRAVLIDNMKKQSEILEKL